MLGWLVVVFFAHVIGAGLALSGILIGFVGLIMHFVSMFVSARNRDA
jgi:hypothetical protein